MNRPSVNSASGPIASAVIVILLLAVLLSSCRPSSVLSSREMRALLIDLHRADAVLQVAGYNYGHDEAVAKYYQSVLDKHGVTQAQFDSSLVWYTDNPQIFDKIYPRVVAELEKEQQAWKERYIQAGQREVVERDLRPVEDVIDELRYGMHYFWPDLSKNEEKNEKSEEKFAYVIIFS